MKKNKKILLASSLFLGVSAIIIPTTFTLTSCSNDEQTIDYTQPLQPNYLNDLSIILPDNAVRKMDSSSSGVENIVKYLGWQDTDVNSYTYGARYYLTFDKSTNEVCAIIDDFAKIKDENNTFIDTHWGMKKPNTPFLTISNEIKLPTGYYINETNQTTVKIKGMINAENIIDFNQIPGNQKNDKYLSLFPGFNEDSINSSIREIKHKNIDLTNTNIEYINSYLPYTTYDDNNTDQSIEFSFKGPSKLKCMGKRTWIGFNIYNREKFKNVKRTIDLSMCCQLKDLNGYINLPTYYKNNDINSEKIILPNSVQRIDGEISCKGLLNINLSNIKYIRREAFDFDVEFPNNTVNLSPDTLYYRGFSYPDIGSFKNENLIINGGKPLN